MTEIIEKAEKSDLVKKKHNFKLIFLFLFLIAAGVGTGYFLSIRQAGVDAPVARDIEEGEITVGTTVGVSDEKTFRDSAEGELKKGGIDGEGSHHLERPGGETQYVYLTSSVVDLDKFVGRKIKVWGETFSAQKAAWLMDVGKVKVLN
jgi:hypothetical protein